MEVLMGTYEKSSNQPWIFHIAMFEDTGAPEGKMFVEANVFLCLGFFHVGQVNSVNSPLKILKKVWNVWAIDPKKCILYIYI